MKFTLVIIITLALVLPMLEACSRRTKKRSGEPYYFGTQNLLCLMSGGKKSKRSAPSVFGLALSHRLVKYNGYVIDYLGNTASVNGMLRPERYVSGCDLEWERQPASYSTVSITCLRQCIANWKNKYWDLKTEYNLFTRNCHDFANRISRILYDNVDCPYWCK